jgi:hypothetical protein
MTESAAGAGRPRTPAHLWIVGVVSLLWNAMGAFDYLASQLKLESYMSQFTEEQLAYFYAFPAWAVSGWAFGVWGALAGSIFLLMRRRWAVWAFAISLAGMAASSYYTLVLTEGIAIMGSGALVFSAVIWAIAILLLVYALAQAKRGILT